MFWDEIPIVVIQYKVKIEKLQQHTQMCKIHDSSVSMFCSKYELTFTCQTSVRKMLGVCDKNMSNIFNLWQNNSKIKAIYKHLI